MKVKLDSNIRAMRKERKLTQEQLAEAMGVTVGAVSKWESGQSTPELGIIVELADFFETSVDVLLGYQWRDGSMGKFAERIKQMMMEKKFDEGVTEADKALQKFPNCFEIVYVCASLFCMKGLESRNKRELRRAQELYERACELIDQNHDLDVSVLSLENDIARIYMMLGDTESALEKFKKNNVECINSGAIGSALATAAHKPDEALPYLSESLWHSIISIFRDVSGYVNAYDELGEYANALNILLWMQSLLEGLKIPGRASYLDRCDTMLFVGAACMATKLGDLESAKEYMSKACVHAKIADAAQNFNLSELRFHYGSKYSTTFDDFGSTAMEGILKTIRENKDITDKLMTIFLEVNTNDESKH